MDRKYFTNIKVEILGADLVIENADIAVEFTKTDEKKPNYCEITIFNLSDDTYNRINSKANSARVYVDIDGLGYALVFAGNLRSLKKWKQAKATAKKKRKSKATKPATIHYNEQPIRREASGADIATIICLEDGVVSTYFNNYINKSYENEVTNQYVLQDILNTVRKQDTNLKVSAESNVLKPYTYPAGVVFHGTLKDVLRSICKTGDAYCTVQDDAIVISSTEQDKSNKAYVYILNGDNCPTPEQSTDKELDIEAPFLPSLNPFNWLKLEFRDYNDYYQVKKIQSKIDNFGEDAESKITVKMDI